MKTKGQISINISILLGITGSLMMLIGVFLPFVDAQILSMSLLSFDSPNSLLKDLNSKGIVSIMMLVLAVLCLVSTFLNKVLQGITASSAGVVLLFYSVSVFTNTSHNYIVPLSIGVGPFVIFAGCILNVISSLIRKTDTNVTGKSLS